MTADTHQHYVKTTDAQAAVRGRELEIIQTCGIDWQPGRRTHTRCPYPHHGGADDWRWDERKARAFCTCQENRKTDSIFDVVSKVEGLDFEASKIRCVEIVGAGNLIRAKSGTGKTGFQATDARSLLNAPAERRDDALPRNYLAHRLGIESGAVLMPTTPAAGLVGLTYYDPPKGKGKPVAVGDFPCAVFGTVDADGKTHAHRIYLAANGAGKAELGQQANGSPRDPKKSAKRPEGDESTAGRSVVWGTPETAPWIITSEGIETAAAVANAFRSEIERGEVAVASAINAGGIEVFKPWPATRRVTVAADRDEAAKFTNPNPSRRGERAARVFGIRNHEQIAVSIAIAGASGTSRDWLDVHEAEGSEGVRSGILSAATFIPTTSETDEEARRIHGLDELAETARLYPIPAVENMSLDYQRAQSGRILVHRYVRVGDEIEPQALCSPFGVAARLRFADEGDTYGLRIVVQDMGGRRRPIDVDRAAFARQGAAETRAMLLAAGLRSYGDAGEADIVRCLKGADPQNEIAVIRRPGWSDINGPEDRFFVCPSGRVIGATNDNAPELSVNSRISAGVALGGTLEAWKNAVAAACAAPRCEHWTIGVMAGFAAPLVALCGLDTCGINLSGMTSGGKTTAQRLAVSVWSRAALDQRDSLLQSARATANGIEGMAARSNATVLALDELGHVNGKELGKIIYSLASGSGKARMTSDAQLRPSHVWSTFVVLSAEKSLEEKVTGDGGEWYGGMAVRIPDIDITGVDRAVDQAVMAEIGAIDRNFGHAGPAFVEALIANGLHQRPQEIRDGINATAKAIAGANADGKLIRAAIPFAILTTAGQMAKRFGLLPTNLDVPRAIRWAWNKFTISSDAVALDPEAQATANLQSWIAERWGSSIHPTERDIGERGSTRDALGWYDDTAVYIPAGRIVEAAGGTLKEIEISRALDRQGLIAKTKDKDCFFVKRVPKVGPVKAYALKRSAFGRSGWGEPDLAVHAGGRA